MEFNTLGLNVVNNESQWLREGHFGRIRSPRPHIQANEAQAGDGVEQKFSSVFSAIAESSDTETSGNSPEDAAAQQPVALAAQIVQHLLIALQNRVCHLSLLSYPLPPSGCDQWGICS